jgi:hypothetical protein
MTELVDLSSKQIIVEDEVIPDDIPLMELADKVVRGKVKLSPQQQRMLIEMLPYIAPKLSATAIATMDGKTFAEALERAIERSKQPSLPAPMIEHEPLPAEELKRPFSNYRNNFRRY